MTRLSEAQIRETGFNVNDVETWVSEKLKNVHIERNKNDPAGSWSIDLDPSKVNTLLRLLSEEAGTLQRQKSKKRKKKRK